jgi:hypothetical protein
MRFQAIPRIRKATPDAPLGDRAIRLAASLTCSTVPSRPLRPVVALSVACVACREGAARGEIVQPRGGLLAASIEPAPTGRGLALLDRT